MSIKKNQIVLKVNTFIIWYHKLDLKNTPLICEKFNETYHPKLRILFFVLHTPVIAF